MIDPSAMILRARRALTMTDILGRDFDPVALGKVKRVTVETTEAGTMLLVTFEDRGALAVRAKLGESLTLDVRPAPLV